jgi:4a-hydroxytetrahydrobiopterin dehydratase
MPGRLRDDEIAKRLANLQHWSNDNGKLSRDFKFADFVTAFGFMTRAAMEAEKMNHHPEWSNVYNRVSVNLVTHEAKGITELDFALAEKMEALAAS